MVIHFPSLPFFATFALGAVIHAGDVPGMPAVPEAIIPVGTSLGISKEYPNGTASGGFAHEGAIFLGCIPNLLMLRDADGDGRAEIRKTIAQGFGGHIAGSNHHLGGFALGPDGRIYGCVSDCGFSFTTQEGVVCNHPNQGAVFRFDADGTGFEVFHTGLHNPKEIVFDALGYPFVVDKNSSQGDSARVVYLVEGGDSGWETEHRILSSFHLQIGLPDLPPNRWMTEKMGCLANPDQPAYMIPPIGHLPSCPEGLACHPGVGFLESEANRFLVCDHRATPAASSIRSFEVKPDGAGMKLANSRLMLQGIAASDVEFSWDGRLFITDSGGRGQSKGAGRVLTLDAGPATWLPQEAASAAKIMNTGLEQRSSAELANLLKHPDARIRLRAQISLTRKPDAYTRFYNATLSSNFQMRIHGIWGLGILARRGPSPLPFNEFGTVPSSETTKAALTQLVALLDDKNEEIRSQSLRALADSPPQAINIPLGPLLADPAPRVRYFATILAAKHKLAGYFGPICEMLEANNNQDSLLRHAGAFALQQITPDPDSLRIISTHPSSAVRLATVVALRRMKSDPSAFIRDADPKVADEAIRAICDLDLTEQRSSVAALLDDLTARQWSPFMLRRLLHNSFRMGDADNAGRILKFATDTSQARNLRAEAFRLLSIWTNPPPVDPFTGHWRPLTPRAPSTLLPLLKKHLPALLRRNDLSLAAALGWIGQYHISVATLKSSTLRTFVTDTGLPSAARANALDLLIQRKLADPTAFLTKILRDDNTPADVALAALRHLVKTAPAAAIPAIEAAPASSRPVLSQSAWPLLAAIPGEAADAIFVKHIDQLRAANGISHDAIELIDSAKKRTSPGILAALTALEKILEENSDSLAKWNITLQGGNPETGKTLFTTHAASACTSCHRTDEIPGEDVAPNLSGIATRQPDRRQLLQSLLNPDSVITPGFGTVTLHFHQGANLRGNLIADTPTHLDLDHLGKVFRIQRSGITSISNPVSAMPPMSESLKPAELRDLLAWLASLTRNPSSAPAPAAAPTPLDPASLIVPRQSH